jgi:ParB-like chromosome segregation protein Spo0J
MRSLKASLRKHGLVTTLVVQRKSQEFGPMVVVAGHQRIKALRELCKETKVEAPKNVWAVVRDVTDSQAKQLNIALNRISGEFDPHMLGEVFVSIASLTDFEPIAVGFREEEISELVRQATTTPEDLANEQERQAGDLDIFARSITLTIEFDTVEQRGEAKGLLKELAGKRKAGSALLPVIKASLASKRKAKR